MSIEKFNEKLIQWADRNEDFVKFFGRSIFSFADENLLQENVLAFDLDLFFDFLFPKGCKKNSERFWASFVMEKHGREATILLQNIMEIEIK